MADEQVAALVEQIDDEDVCGARRLGAAVAGHGGSSLSVVLAGGPYWWISKALSTLRHLNHSHRRRIDVAGGRVENGEAFSTRHFQATSLPCHTSFSVVALVKRERFLVQLPLLFATIAFAGSGCLENVDFC